MDFYEVLDHGVDLLRRRSRVTYRTVKLQFVAGTTPVYNRVTYCYCLLSTVEKEL